MIILCNQKGPAVQFISDGTGVIASVKQLKLSYKDYLHCATIKSYIHHSCLYSKTFQHGLPKFVPLYSQPLLRHPAAK